MKYAIIDLEWLSKPYKNIVQIGGIMFDNDNKEISRFYKIIRPAVKLRQKEADFMHLTADALNSGISITSAAKQFIFWLNGCRELIVWSEDAQQMLHELLSEYEDMMYHKIIALKCKYKIQLGEASFENTCKRFGIKICNPLHISINDCIYLASVYRILYNIPPWVDKRTVIAKSFDAKQYRKSYSNCTYTALPESSVFHRKSCHYIYEKNNDRKISFFNSEHAVILGYEPCKCCKPDTANVIREKWNYDEIEEYCSALKLRCVIYPECIYVTTDISSWFFKSGKDTIVLYHSNFFRRNHYKHNKWKEDYHEQQKRFDDPMDAVYYIYCHDKSASKARI